MKRMLMAFLAVAVAVTFSAPAFAGEKKKEKPAGDHVVVYADKDKKKQDGGHADEAFGKKKEAEGEKADEVFGKKKEDAGK